jgi:drug/metabolite transporter (DMT)-like permease
MHRPLLLLLATGCLLAININLAKAAHDAGAAALTIALVSTGGGGLVLLGLAFKNKVIFNVEPKRLVFYAIAGAVSYALPNLLIFAAAGRVGPAFAAMMHAFVPSLTYIVAIFWSMDHFAPRRGFGLLLGLMGAATIIVARLGFSTQQETAAILLVLIAPLSTAFGNVIRSRFWPKGAQPLDIAPGMLLFAAFELCLVLPFQLQAITPLSASALQILAIQVVVSAAFYLFYFRLQHVAGPVYLSQIGYVGTLVAVPISLLLFAEKVTLPMLVGVALVVCGIFLVRPSSSATVRDIQKT